MKVARQQYRKVKLSEVEPHPRNPRRGSLEAIAESLAANDFYGAIVVQKGTGYVLAGNHRLLAAKEAGAKELPAMVVDCDDETALRILLADNATSDKAEYDSPELHALLKEIGQEAGTLEGTGWGFEDFRALEREMAKLTNGEAGADEVPEPPAEPRSKPGEIYELGPHRLMCGDAFDDAARRLLYGDAKIGAVLTDPPYGIGLVPDWSSLSGSKKASWHKPGRDWTPHGESNTWEAVPGDDRPFDAAPLVAFFAGVEEQFWFGGDYYRRTLSESDLDGCYLVWDKRNEHTDAVIGSGFELVWSRQPHKRDLLRHYFLGSYGAEARERVHPTQKPTTLLAEILTRWTKPAYIVADPFLGSGSTLLACDKTDRICFGMEIEPRYCDVIRDRYEAFVAARPVAA